MIVLGSVFLALAPVAVYARMGTVVLLIATLIAQPCFDGTMATLRRFSKNPIVIVGALLTLWAMVSLLWTPEPSIIDVARTAIVPVMGLLLVGAIQALPSTDSQRLARCAMIGGIALLALLSLEVWTRGALVRLILPPEGIIPPGQKSFVVEVAARGAAVLAPLVFIFTSLIYARTSRASFAILFVAVAFAVTQASTMDAAWLAVTAGAIVFCVALYAPRMALVGLFGALIAYALLAPIISTYLLTPDLVPMTGAVDMKWVGTQTRLSIWQEASRLIAEQPLWGHGFDSTRVLAKTAPLISGTPWSSLPLHTHNGFLQIWLELGAVGIAAVVIMLGFTARALWPMTARPQHLAMTLATLTSTAVIGLISFGIWQHWWLATWMLAAGLLHLTLRQQQV